MRKVKKTKQTVINYEEKFAALEKQQNQLFGFSGDCSQRDIFITYFNLYKSSRKKSRKGYQNEIEKILSGMTEVNNTKRTELDKAKEEAQQKAHKEVVQKEREQAEQKIAAQEAKLRVEKEQIQIQIKLVNFGPIDASLHDVLFQVKNLLEIDLFKEDDVLISLKQKIETVIDENNQFKNQTPSKDSTAEQLKEILEIRTKKAADFTQNIDEFNAEFTQISGAKNEVLNQLFDKTKADVFTEVGTLSNNVIQSKELVLNKKGHYPTVHFDNCESKLVNIQENLIEAKTRIKTLVIHDKDTAKIKFEKIVTLQKEELLVNGLKTQKEDVLKEVKDKEQNYHNKLKEEKTKRGMTPDYRTIHDISKQFLKKLTDILTKYSADESKRIPGLDLAYRMGNLAQAAQDGEKKEVLKKILKDAKAEDFFNAKRTTWGAFFTDRSNKNNFVNLKQDFEKLSQILNTKKITHPSL